MFITNHRWTRLQIMHPVQLQPAKDAAHRSRTEAELLGDPRSRPALASEISMTRSSGVWRGEGRTAILQPYQPLPSVTSRPLRRTLSAELELGPSSKTLFESASPLITVCRA
jgi:hypothetical protein